MVLGRMFYHAPHGYAKVTLQPLILPYNLNDAGIDTVEAIIQMENKKLCCAVNENCLNERLAHTRS